MTKEKMQKLVDALRSGKYQQGRHSLHVDGKFCCLGVACVINGMTPKYEWGFKETYSYHSLNFHKAKDITGFKTECGNFKNHIEYKDNKYGSLAELNDAGMSFNEIADVIEKVYKEL